MGNELMNNPVAVAAAKHDAALVETKREAAFNLTPRNLQEAFQLSEMLAQSEMVPKDYRGKPANILVAVQWGHEVGLKPLQALQNIAVINGRPSLWGDALVALVRNSPLCEFIIETTDAAGTAFCQVKRRGEPEQVRSFSDADAKQAGLLGKDGPWKTNPKRMKQMRARAFALRDVFADVLKGMAMAEELMDLPIEAVATPAGQLAGAAPAVPPELLKAGQDASAAGVAAYEKWWKSITKEERVAAQFEHPNWKDAAIRADAEKAIAATPAAVGVVGEAGPTFGDDTLGGQAAS
jgi:hypothetical protein